MYAIAKNTLDLPFALLKHAPGNADGLVSLKSTQRIGVIEAHPGDKTSFDVLPAIGEPVDNLLLIDVEMLASEADNKHGRPWPFAQLLTHCGPLFFSNISELASALDWRG